MNSFKEFLNEYNKIDGELSINLNSVHLNEMAKWEDVLVLDGNDNILYSKITDQDTKLEKIRDGILYYKKINNHYIFKLAFNNIVLVYIQTILTDFNIDGRTTLAVEVSKRANELKGYKYGMEIYLYLLHRFCLVSDSSNTPDSMRVWQSVSNDNRFENGIYNTKTNSVCERNIKLSVGDKRVWIKYDPDSVTNILTGKPLTTKEIQILKYHRIFAYLK